jgi:rSAM/selenodomain-associated transferase 1
MAIDPDRIDVAVAIMTRAPTPGATKTRLIPRLGADGAAELHRHLIRHALATVAAARLGPVMLWCAPDASDPFLVEVASAHGVATRSQPDGDLGARMHAAFAERSPLLLMGTDAPVIDPRLLRACATSLRDHDAVFLPAEDGGYALVGLRRPAPALFENMVWSVDTVMAETRRRLRARGMTFSEPATVWDVDRPADVDRLIASGLLPEWRPLLA